MGAVNIVFDGYLSGGSQNWYKGLLENVGIDYVFNSKEKHDITIALGAKKTWELINRSRYGSFDSICAYLIKTPNGIVIPSPLPKTLYMAPQNKLFLEKAVEKAHRYNQGYRDKAETLKISNSKREVEQYLLSVLQADYVSLDIETNGVEGDIPNEVTAIGIGADFDTALCVTPDSDAWDMTIDAVRKVMENPNKKVIGQNFTNFDSQVLYWMYGIRTYCQIWDTMTAFKLLYPYLTADDKGGSSGRSADLALQGAAYLYCAPWKDEGWKERGMKLRAYCAKDVVRTYRIAKAQEKELKQVGNFSFFKDRVMPMEAIVSRAMIKGINFDHKERERQKGIVEKEVENLRKQLQDAAKPYLSPLEKRRNMRDQEKDTVVEGLIDVPEDFQKLKRKELDALLFAKGIPKKKAKEYYIAKKQDAKKGLEPGKLYKKAYKEIINLEARAFNPNSTPQKLDIFKNMNVDVPNKFKPSTKTWGPGVGELELKKIINKEKGRDEVIRFCKLLLDYAPLSKFYTGYLNARFMPDGRWRSAFRILNTKTTRASSKKYFGGKKKEHGFCGQLQNIPSRIDESKVFKKCFIPDSEDYYFFNADLSAAESWIVAHMANCKSMLDILKGDKDFHTETARLMFNKDAITSKERSMSKPFSHGCLDASHEVLTKEGWINIADYKDQEIAVWDKSEEIRFEKPKYYHVYEDGGIGYKFTGNRIETTVTANHRFPNKTSQGNINALYAEDLANRKTGLIPCSGYFFGDKKVGPNELLQMAIQADGSFSCRTVRFHLRKDRKANRLKILLDACGISYREAKDRLGDYNISFKKADVKFNIVDADTKLFNISGLFDFNQRGLLFLLEESFKWDGTEADNGKRQYRSKPLANCEFVQTLAHLCGKQASAPRTQSRANIVSVANRKLINRSCFSEIKKVKLGKVYCFTTSTGYFLTKTPKGIYVTGNSPYGMGLFVMWGNLLKAGISVDQERVKELHGLWHAAYPEIKENFQKGIEDKIKTDRYLVNPLGRKRYFDDKPISDKVFNEAYADIPQSTVPWVANEMWLSIVKEFEDHEVFVFGQAHDSVFGQVRKDLKDKFEKWLKAKGEEIKITINGQTFSIPWDIKFGKNYYEVN